MIKKKKGKLLKVRGGKRVVEKEKTEKDEEVNEEQEQEEEEEEEEEKQEGLARAGQADERPAGPESLAWDSGQTLLPGQQQQEGSFFCG